MPLDYVTFIYWFPEFSGLPQGVVDFRLTLSNDFLYEHSWGKYYQRAVALLTAHYLSLRYNITSGLTENGVRSPSSTVGITTSKSATTSGLSETSAVSSLATGDDPFLADLARTGYGLEFLSLLYLVVPACDVVYSADTSSRMCGDKWL